MPYIGKKPENIIATAVDSTTGDFSGNVTAGGTLGVTGAATFSGAFTSQGIDDNADATAITISSGEVVTLSNNLITNGNVLRGVDNSSNTFSGGTASNSGSNIAVYGSSHSSLANNVRFRNGSTQTMLVDSTGAVTIANGLTLTDGNLVVASGHGIDFSATSNSSGSMSGELFSDYEEGAWTPTYTGSGGNPTVTYDALQFGFYTRIGRKVFIIGRLRTDAVSGGSGLLQVSGLPYTVNSSLNSNNYTSGGGIVSDAFGSNNPHSTMAIAGTTSFYGIYGNYNVNQTSDLQDGSNKNQIQFSFFYIAQ